MNQKYDIFISYRRRDAGEKAEHLKDLLESKYEGRISFDRENLTGLFASELIQRIDTCKDFLLVIAQDSFQYVEKDFEEERVELYRYLATCTQQDFEAKIDELGPNANLDFVRVEMARALQRKDLNIIPIVPQSTESFKFAELNLPPDIVRIKSYEAIFYSDNADALFKDIVPKLLPHLKSRRDIPFKGLLYTIISLLLIIVLAWGGWKYYEYDVNTKKISLQNEIVTYFEEKGMDKILNQNISFAPNVSLEQLQVINEILHKMILVEGGTFMQGAPMNADGTYDSDVDTLLDIPQSLQTVNTFYMAQYEMSIKEWNEIMKREYEVDSSMYPITLISFDECVEFVNTLYNMTGLKFNLPTETQWEYAARGGDRQQDTKFAGSNNPEKIAWYAKNSKNQLLVCDGVNYSIDPNALDIFNMSGNVSEWCYTLFRPYNPQVINPDTTAMVIRGGAYDSPSDELTVYHRSPMKSTAEATNVGLRLVLNKY